MEDQASSHNFLSVIFGILGNFWIGIGTMRIAVNYPPLLIVDFFVDSCLQYFLCDFERNCRSLIWKMIICRLKSTIAEFSKITKVLIVETKLIVDRLLRKIKFVDTSLQILISSCIFGSSILKIFACGALKSL